MATRAKRVRVTVGDLIAAAFDVVGDRLEQVVDLLRSEEMRKRTKLIVEGELPETVPRQRRN